MEGDGAVLELVEGGIVVLVNLNKVLLKAF
jgi:hypothetical protein